MARKKAEKYHGLLFLFEIYKQYSLGITHPAVTLELISNLTDLINHKKKNTKFRLMTCEIKLDKNE